MQHQTALVSVGVISECSAYLGPRRALIHLRNTYTSIPAISNSNEKLSLVELWKILCKGK